MKKIIALLLALVIFVSISANAFADTGKFDKSVFAGKTSSYHGDSMSGEWNIQDHYIKKYTNAEIKLYVLLFDSYVEEGWGPELRVSYYNRETHSYDKMIAFRAVIDNTTFYFEDLADGGDCGYAFGGKTMERFMNSLISAKTVAFQFVHENQFGDVYTSTEDHVHTGEVAELGKLARFLRDSHAWSIDPDPEGSDKYYGASYVVNK